MSDHDTTQSPENPERDPGETMQASKTQKNRFAPVLWLLIGFVLAGLVFADPFGVLPVDDWLRASLGGDTAEEAMAETSESGLWTCGMHPNVIQEEPGTCPICGMDLVPMRGSAGGSAEAGGDHAGHDHGGDMAAGDAEPVWICEDFPELEFDEPGECPVDGTALVKKGGASEMSRGGSMSAQAGRTGAPVVTIDPVVVQNMNVQTAPVERRTITREIRTVGYLEYDQQKMVSVTTKYSGFIEKVYVNYKGQPVRKGEPLFEIYSPELVQTEQELLSALEFAERMKGAPEQARRRAESLVEAARQRLSYWDITPEQVARLEETGEVHRTLTVTAPASGVVMMRMPGLEGMAAKPGMELFHIADLSSLWLNVEVFEDQLAWVREGSMADVNLSYFPGEQFSGRVRYIEPEVSEETRTVSLMLEVPNRNRKLKSGMYATVIFRPPAAEDAIAVPSQAVLRTGDRNVVIVALGDGRFAPREVTLGVAGKGYVQVLDGLAGDERIVTSSQFLIDSESNLKAAIQKMVDQKREKAMKQAAEKGGGADA